MMKRAMCVFCAAAICVYACGCEAAARKFRRKPRKDQVKVEEQVVAPEEYALQMRTGEEAYREDFFIWKSWHEELIYWLVKDGNYKKQLDCLNETRKSLQGLAKLLNEDYGHIIEGFTSELDALEDALRKDPYGLRVDVSRRKAQVLFDKINRELILSKVKDALR